MKKVIFVLLTIIVLAICVYVMSTTKKSDSNNGTELKKITFALDWTPNTNHTGLYVAKEKGYFEVIAHVYIAEFDKKITEPIEKDHTVLWVNPKDYIGKMCREWQEHILKEYIWKARN